MFTRNPFLFAIFGFVLSAFFTTNFVLSQCGANTLTTTFANNNGQNGNMFDVVALTDIEIFCFDTHFNFGTINYEIYYKLGSAIGSQSNPGAWFLAGSGTGIATAGPGNGTRLSLANPIQVCAGTRVAFYITNTGAGPTMNYTNGSALGNVFTANANLQIMEGYGMQYPFSTSFQPRIWNGRILYNNIVLCTPLPIELLYFKAFAKEKEVELLWSTATEINNDYFTIEKSQDGKEWGEIGRVLGAGNSENKIEYSFIDKTPYPGTSYYRIKQTDFDGVFEYSNIESVEIKGASVGDLKIYPNPAQNQFFVMYHGIEFKEFSLVNSLGQDVVNNLNLVHHNNDVLELQIINLPKGIYFFSVEGVSMKIVVQD